MTELSENQRRRSFGIWLRTGRIHSEIGTGAVEVKFNHRHDPADGRFTFGGSGHANGRSDVGHGRVGGGGFGGAGASSKEKWPHSSQRSTLSTKVKPSAKTSHTGSTTSQIVVRRPAALSPEDFSTENRNGYTYEIDDRGRTRRVTGSLTVGGKQARSRTAQSQAGGSDRRPTDDGGHYIAARFKGPTDAFNHFAQDANFNRGDYRTLESNWARASGAGKTVTVKIIPAYEGSSRRPSAINVRFMINGHEESMKFANEPKEQRHGK